MPSETLRDLPLDSDRLKSINFNLIHTRPGDVISLEFIQKEPGKGVLTFGFSGGMEHALAVLDFGKSTLSFRTTDWRLPQPCATRELAGNPGATRTVTIEKRPRPNGLIENADITVYLDGERALHIEDVNVLPEIGVGLNAEDIDVRRFIHRGTPSGMPESIRVGGWQMLNLPSIEDNLASLERGIRKAADAGVEFLVTPETSLTGLFPGRPVTQDREAIEAAERRLRQMLRDTADAPYLVVGLPVWERHPRYQGRPIRYNGARVYAPDGTILSTHAKIHTCEYDFWHSYRLQEYDIKGVPVAMHICHDARYPDVWTLPVMFGARLVVRPANSGHAMGTVDGYHALAKSAPNTSHAFHISVDGCGGSYIASPHKGAGLLAISDECRHDNPDAPNVGAPVECLIHADINVDEAFGYWPVRSFRASEEVASAYLALYRAMGGRRM